MKKFMLVILFIIAIVMIALSFKMQVLAPALTGVGFILIGLLFTSHKK
jgi:small-conductance mechanosensitive channel